MKTTLYILTLEKIEQRYTKQWHTYFKKEFSKYFKVVYIDGPDMNDIINKGRFSDINKTNLWKSEQVKKLSQLFMIDKINDGDKFFFMDGWHFGVTALKYMLQLNNIKSKIYTYWHAGTWDKYDFITQAGLSGWANFNELGWMLASDKMFVATNFHKKLINDYFGGVINEKDIIVVGFPMDWNTVIKQEIGIFNNVIKNDLIVFPHRLDKEKQPEVFDKVGQKFLNYDFIKTMEITKNKKEYYNLIKNAKIAFSSSLQETFGIGTVEALMLGCIPLVPNRLSYVELYDSLFRYNDLIEAKQKIKYFIENYYKSSIHKIIRKNQDKINKLSLNSIERMSKIMLK